MIWAAVGVLGLWFLLIFILVEAAAPINYNDPIEGPDIEEL